MTPEISRPRLAPLPPFLVLPVRETPSGLRRAPATLGVVGASLATVALGGPWPAVTRSFEATTSAFADGELWRLVTYVLPHEHGWWHVVVNMVVLSLFGWQYEHLVGGVRLLAVYVGSGAVGMALLFASNSLDAASGLRAGASLAVFGVVAALTVRHAIVGGVRGEAMPWAAGTCLVLLVASGVLAVDGHSGATEPGLDGFTFGFANHALGMVAGALLGLAIPAGPAPRTRMLAGAAASLSVVVGVVVGLARWA